MRRFFFSLGVLAVAAGCADGGSNPVSADGVPAVRTSSGQPNLYISWIQPQRDANGQLKVRIRVCNNGTAPAGASTTYLEHWYGIWYEIYDLYTTQLSAGWCTVVTSPPLGERDGLGHSYYVKADDYLVIAESNENDNEMELDVAP